MQFHIASLAKNLQIHLRIDTDLAAEGLSGKVAMLGVDEAHRPETMGHGLLFSDVFMVFEPIEAPVVPVHGVNPIRTVRAVQSVHAIHSIQNARHC